VETATFVEPETIQADDDDDADDDIVVTEESRTQPEESAQEWMFRMDDL